MEKNKDFPNVFHAVLILTMLFGIELLIGSILYDFGIRASAGDPKYEQLFHPSTYATGSALLIMIIPIVMVIGGGFLLISDIDKIIIKHFPMSQKDIEMFSRLIGGGSISIITVCIIAPLIEEMLFRGIFLRSFLSRYRAFNAITFSSLLFALCHLNIYQMLAAYILGSFLGYLYVATQSLWPCIFAHASFNAISLVYYELYGGFEKSLEVETHHSPYILMIAVLFVLGGLAIINRANKTQHPNTL
jgi:membrane protease YdiL (CAAX protease family)